MIGDKIKCYRKKNKMTQEQLAEKLDITRQTLSKWEVGETSPDINTSKKIAEILNVSLDELLDNDWLLVSHYISKKRIVFLSIVLCALLCLAFVWRYRDGHYSRILTSTITCKLDGKIYIIDYSYYKNTGDIFQKGGSEIFFIEKLDNTDFYIAKKQITDYFKNKGSKCHIKTK